MAKEFRIGTGYLPANGKFSSSNLHIHKERKKNANVNSTPRCSIFGGGVVEIIMDTSATISNQKQAASDIDSGVSNTLECNSYKSGKHSKLYQKLKTN